MKAFQRFDDKIPVQIAWVPDGSGLLMLYGAMTGIPRGRLQIGFLSYPSGEFRIITNDTDNYGKFAVAADGKILVSVQVQSSGEIDLLDGTGTGTPLTVPNVPKKAQIEDVSWDDDTHLLISQGNRLVRIAKNGTQLETLVNDTSAAIYDTTACSDGRYFVFAWDGHGGGNRMNIWRVGPDRSEPERLTEGKNDSNPVCSPDGKWMYFANSDDGQLIGQLMRVPIDGGKPERLPGSVLSASEPLFLGKIALSRDGRTIASVAPFANAQRVVLVQVDSNSQAKPRLLNADRRATGGIQFTPDGTAVAYVIEDRGVDNIWIQPLDGSPGHQLTNFASDSILSFCWSPNGEILAFVRSESTSNVVLLRDTNGYKPTVGVGTLDVWNFAEILRNQVFSSGDEF
jgi:Tol biopolymer transport system component